MTQDKIFKEKDTLLAFLSHEIRNPVQAIIAGSQFLFDQTKNEVDFNKANSLIFLLTLFF